MILYIIKSTLCLTLFIGIYYFLLEREKMHQFNRFYLLGSILFSISIPSLDFSISSTFLIDPVVSLIPERIIIPENIEVLNGINDTYIQSNLGQSNINYAKILFWIYSVVALILSYRFIKNLYIIIKKIGVNRQVPYKNATLILLSEEISSHTFMKYIFLNENEFKNNKLNDEVLTHELAHVNQKHTIDILIIETLQIVFWFNPLLPIFKRAIKLNHEFLADERVIRFHNNPIFYQELLINKSSEFENVHLASDFNFLIAKKRLNKISATKNKFNIFVKKICLIPLFITMTFLSAQGVESSRNASSNNFSLIQEKESIGKFAIEDAKNIATNMISPENHIRMNTQAYYEGKLKIITIPDEQGKEIVIGLDSNNDGEYDFYFFLQTTNNFDINEEIINGQILYAQSCFIVNNTNKEFIKFFTLNPSDERVVSILERTPVEIKHRLNGNFIQGFGVGTSGNSNEYGYGKIFNKN